MRAGPRTATARRPVPAAPQAPQARTYFPAPIYGRHAPTLPPDEPWEAVTAVRPDTAHVRALRFLGTAGDLLAAVVLIGGGMGLIGLATHL